MNLKIQNIRKNHKKRTTKFRLHKIYTWTIKKIKSMSNY